jgi:hypothetical protein
MPCEDGRIPDVRQRLNAVMAGVNLPDGVVESPRHPVREIRDVESEFVRVRNQREADRERSELLDLLASSSEAKAICEGMGR